MLVAQRAVEDGVGIGSVEAHGSHLVQGSCFIVQTIETRLFGFWCRVSTSWLCLTRVDRLFAT